VSIAVAPPPNVAPTAQDVTAEAVAGVATTITLSGSDPETCQLSFVRADTTLTSGATVGGLANEPCTGSGPFQDTATVSYRAPAGFSGPDSFTYTVHDGADGSNTATVSVSVALPPNVAPTAQDVTTDAVAGIATSITLTGADPETCQLAFDRPAATLTSGATVTEPSNTPCSGSGPFADTATVTYTAPIGFSGPDSFTYTVHDGTDPSTEATVSITVSQPPVNTAPVADDVTATATEGRATTITLSGTDEQTCELTFDAPSLTPVAGASVGDPAYHPCTGAGPHRDTATVTYTAPVGFTGQDSFTTATVTAGVPTPITLAGADPEQCELLFDRPEATLTSGETTASRTTG
jgi:Big-like domain-containing protein